MDDLQSNMRSVRTYLRGFLLKKGFQLNGAFHSRLPNFRENDGCGVGRAHFSSSEHDLVSQEAAKGLELIQNVVELRTVSFLLLPPPIPQSGALLEPIVEEPPGFIQSVGDIRNRGVDDGIVRNIRQQVGVVAQSGAGDCGE